MYKSNSSLTLNLSTFTSSTQGMVSASGGGTTNFLRADGSWAAPAGGGGTTTNSLTFNTTGGASSGATFNGASAVTVDYHTVGAQQLNTNLTSLAGMATTTGFVKQTSANTFGIDTNTYLTANQSITVSGDASGSGSTAITLTLATVNSNIGTWNNVTVNGKGLVTAGSNTAYLTANQSITLSGDLTGSGTTAITGTLATVNTNTGSWGSASNVPTFTVNGKGLITAASNTAISITPSAAGLGNVTNDAQVKLSTVTTAGDLIYSTGNAAVTRLGIGTSSQVLIGGSSAPAWSNISGLSVSSATTATNIAGGAAGSIPYNTGSGATSLLAAGTSSQVLVSGTTPAWSTLSGIAVTSVTGTSQQITASASTGAVTLSLPNPAAAITSASSGINTSETVLEKLLIGAAAAGSVYAINLFGTCTSTAANVSTFTVRVGTAGTTSDTSVGTATCTAATSGTTIAFMVCIIVTFRTSTSVFISSVINNTGITGISSSAYPVVGVGSATSITSSSSNYLDITYKSAVSTTTSTFQTAVISQIR